MGSALSSFFIPLDQLPDVRQLPENCISEEFPSKDFNLFGFIQLVFLALAYGSIVLQGSMLIADGSELLLLIPSIAPVVGSLVLPVLGAVPDGTIVIFSGMGPIDQVQKELSIGVGALAGSTIMLLTVPWFLSVLSGRVDIKYSKPMYFGKPKLSGKINFWKTGVRPDLAATRIAAKTMLFTTIPYFIIQGAAFAFYTETEKERSKKESNYALIGLIICLLFFIGYLYMHLKGASHDKVTLDRIDEARFIALKSRIITFQAAFKEFFDEQKKPEFFRQASMWNSTSSSRGGSTVIDDPDGDFERYRKLVHKFFKEYDSNKNDSIDKRELSALLREMNLVHSDHDIHEFFTAFDVDESGEISFDEFFHGINEITSKSLEQVVVSSTLEGGGGSTQYGTIETTTTTNNNNQQHHGENEDDDEEEEEIPEDIKTLPLDKQKSEILKRSFLKVFFGLTLVIIFSDPLVDVFSKLGELCGISGFYISFMLAPLASNASEILASYFYAQKKTTKTITISLCTLMGAAILNNTFVLGIFLSLIKFRGLDWEFSAETITIFVVELCVGIITLTREIHTVKWAFIVLLLFPISLFLVAFLESSYVGLD